MFANLREYLDRGGFLFVDDFRTAAFSRQTGAQARTTSATSQRSEEDVSGSRFVRLDLSDPIFSVFYKMKSLE